VVGDGPQLQQLTSLYPTVRFTGVQVGEELAASYASADVFVFPSRTDTFGMVMLEAMASGVPVAAFPAIGPRDVVTNGVSGFYSDDLRASAMAALTLDGGRVREAALAYSWEAAARLFLSNVGAANVQSGHRTAAVVRGLQIARARSA
jgi:glycosyltransferase involved in cell wall biosynthesis